jgi:hypothetical protein
MSVIGDLLQGGISGIFSSAGSLAKDLRTAITGKATLTSEEQTALLLKASELEKSVSDNAAALLQAQADVAKIDAGSNDAFQRRARPFIVWVCGISLAAYYWPQFIFAAILWCAASITILHAGGTTLPAYPLTVNVQEIIGLLAPILGLGALRTYEKKAGVA